MARPLALRRRSTNIALSSSAPNGSIFGSASLATTSSVPSSGFSGSLPSSSSKIDLSSTSHSIQNSVNQYLSWQARTCTLHTGSCHRDSCLPARRNPPRPQGSNPALLASAGKHRARRGPGVHCRRRQQRRRPPKMSLSGCVAPHV
jgi:hypothetical protein